MGKLKVRLEGEGDLPAETATGSVDCAELRWVYGGMARGAARGGR